ncbi:hypothetical protein HALLA_19000 [Halostagnicola larsenii XH-48]|uniref:Uncharacterized protein n=2 Tax=Halostagnicola larsenii TaxID=353800 RepID=W0JR21_9EURY|nr:hypothetical protein HALLA_19000 [Halostagnicola larsenii XH-48]
MAIEAAEAARPRHAESRSDESATEHVDGEDPRRACHQHVSIDVAPELFD